MSKKAEDAETPEGKQPHGKGFLRRFPLFGRTLSWELPTEQQPEEGACVGVAMRKRVSTTPKHPDPRQSFYQYPLPRYSVVVPYRATVIQKVYPTAIAASAFVPEAGDVIASKIASSASAGATGLETCAVMDAAQFRHYEPMPALHGDADGRFLWKFTVGPTGGVLQVMNITMCVPENAVDKQQDIIIGISQNAADQPTLDGKHSLASPVIHCLPHGTRFRRPVALSFGYNAYYTENEMCKLTVLCSETDVGKPTTWAEHEASSYAFGFGDERRCLVVLNRFCLITVVCKDTPDQMQSKDISAMVFAKLGSDSQLLNIRVICVDNELATMDLLRLNCVNSGYGNQVGNEPFFLYYNGKGINVSLDELKACWQIDGKSKMTLSFMKVWCNSRPSCLFDVTPSGDLAPYFKCVVRVAQQDGNEEDQAAHVKVTYEVMKERSKSSRRRTGVVGLPDQEDTDDLFTVNLLRECVDKMIKPRPDSRDSTHSFSDFKKPTTKEFVIPHKLKMELAILLNPIDKLHGRDWRHLASIMGLDDMIPYLDPIGGQTELLLNALDCFNVNLESITAVMREFEREDAAVTIEKYSQTR